MIDLETLGNRPGSVILALGAVKFGGGDIIASFYERIDPESCVAHGLQMDCSTVLWWLQQAEAPRLEITKPGKSLSVVLQTFALWLGEPDLPIWGNGAAFDNVILAEAYARAGIERPWEFWNDRCYRTLKSLHPEVPIDRAGTHHNALDDAKTQAMHLMKLLS